MIFIPCRNGWSHRPDEFSSPGDIERGVKALALTLAKLAGDAGAAACVIRARRALACRHHRTHTQLDAHCVTCSRSSLQIFFQYLCCSEM